VTDRATRRYVEVERNAAARTADHIHALILALASVDDEAEAAYRVRHARLVAAGQLTAARLAGAYLSALIGRGPARGYPDPARVLGGALVTADTPSATSPILRARRELAAGSAFPTALAVAAGYGATLALGDMSTASRLGLDAGAEAHGRRMRFRKELSGSACEWCVEVAGETYGSADAVPFHAGDRCSVVPELED